MTSRPIWCELCNRVHSFQRPPATGPEQVGFWEVVRLTAFVLFFLGAVVYAMPVLLESML